MGTSESPVRPEPIVRLWRPGRPVDLRRLLSVHRRGPGDPCFATDADGALWRSVHTPLGPGTLRVARIGPQVEAQAWGEGALWLLEMLPAWLGEEDVGVGEFRPEHPLLRETLRRRPDWRIGRSGLVLDALIPAILEQKVTGGEAMRAYRRLVRSYGSPAPGPLGAALFTPPDARTWAGIPSWEWHRAGVGPQRAGTAVRAATAADSLQRAVAADAASAERLLRTVPGVGVWTAAEVRQRAVGDADAVSVGDAHVPRLVIFALTGRVSDSDDEMLDLLERYRPHRFRVQQLLELSGLRPPRFGPRYSPHDFRRM